MSSHPYAMILDSEGRSAMTILTDNGRVAITLCDKTGCAIQYFRAEIVNGMISPLEEGSLEDDDPNEKIDSMGGSVN